MVNSDKIFIHIGFRKTATSWLQNKVFKTNSNINYIGKTDKYYPRWLIEWHYLDDYKYEKDKGKIKKEFYDKLSTKKINLLSSEAFTNTGVIYQQALRIKEIVENAKIIITLRDPIDMIVSHYKHDVAEGNSFLKISEYMDWGRTPYYIGKRKPIYLPDFLFDETIDIYSNLFGLKNICILKYEDMKEDLEDFFRILSDFLGVEISNYKNKKDIIINAGVPNDQLLLKKAENYQCYLKKYFPNIDKLVDIDLIKKDMSNLILNNETIKQLQKYYMNKSFGYY